ncbi:hypothetical protein [Fusibacillus kribbianus]|uniref:ABC-2 family transporter protein n=1 Tax=Fusibacillus kribbianus TaxID=3044208 RepID=A0AAP4EXY9_9FIRM|nr:hypothetical protein [Ruminococcus sp. YH-rum2234]MDI9243009.1 hypothetical protein [Ruminococcus sp. YH-rum2234]
MGFFRMLSSDIKRLFLSKRFYMTIVLVIVLYLLTVCTELGMARELFYMIDVRHGLGAFLLAMTILSPIPYGLSYQEDISHNYAYGIEIRVSHRKYCWAKVIATAVGTFLSVFCGYMIICGILSFFHPLISDIAIGNMQVNYQAGVLDPYQKYFIWGHPVFYFVSTFATEAAAYSFMAVFTLMVSTKVRNVFILLSVPAVLYYGNIVLCDILKLPAIFRWNNTMKLGLRVFSSDPVIVLLETIVYFAILIFLAGLVFNWLTERRRFHG